jgi:hypothetical protein
LDGIAWELALALAESIRVEPTRCEHRPMAGQSQYQPPALIAPPRRWLRVSAKTRSSISSSRFWSRAGARQDRDGWAEVRPPDRDQPADAESARSPSATRCVSTGGRRARHDVGLTLPKLVKLDPSIGRFVYDDGYNARRPDWTYSGH